MNKNALLFCLAAWISCNFLADPRGCAAASMSAIRSSVVKIHATFQVDDYAMPWQAERPMSGTGSGFIIEKKRILTNAHVISNARFLQVQKDSDPRRYPARVLFVGHDCDLAILTVDDPVFFEGTTPAVFGKSLPRLNDEVIVLGYPMGGDRISLTKGVVSRIDYSVYMHSGVDQHLVLQVDAAINPGNSGGPVLYNGRVVGLAFQGISWAENIGYAIPLPVIHRFLDDIRDGEYDGYPELGAATIEVRNEALRRDLGLPKGKSGIVVHYVDPFTSAYGILKERDVLLSIDGSRIEDDGSIRMDGETVLFAEVLERKQCGEDAVFQVWRDNREISVRVPLKKWTDPFLYRHRYDERPRYFMVAGLIFSPLTRELMAALEQAPLNRQFHQLVYCMTYAKMDELYHGRDEFVVLVRRLPHQINTYSDSFLSGILVEVNGRFIARLEDIPAALEKPLNGFHVLKFLGMDDSLVIPAEDARQATEECMKQYGIPAVSNIGKETAK